MKNFNNNLYSSFKIMEKKVEELTKNMFDHNLDDSDSDELKIEEDKNLFSGDPKEAKVARPTTKPTDKTKKLEKQSYTFWTEKDKEKLNTFPQFQDSSYIAPKKLSKEA
jgi:hypothetical protein